MTLMYSIWKTQRTKYLAFSKLELMFFSFVHEDWGRPNNMKPLLFTLSRALDRLFSSFYPNAISIVFLGYDKWSLLETVKIAMKLVYLKLFIYLQQNKSRLVHRNGDNCLLSQHFGRLDQEDHKFRANLDYTASKNLYIEILLQTKQNKNSQRSENR